MPKIAGNHIRKFLWLSRCKITLYRREAIGRFCLSSLNRFNCRITDIDKETNTYKLDTVDDDLKRTRIGNLISFNS